MATKRTATFPTSTSTAAGRNTKQTRLAWATATPENWHRIVVGHDHVPDFHKEWFSLLRKYRRLMIKAPRGHAKTEVFSVSYASWWAATHPDDLVMIFSANEYPQAQQILKRISAVFMDNPIAKHLLKGKPTKRRITLRNRTEIVAAGVGMQVRGLAGIKKRPGLLVFDDILPDPGSTLTYDKVEEWFFETAIPMGRPDTKVVVVGTPFMIDDLLAKLEDNPEYHSAIYPAWKTDPATGEVISVLWPEQWSKADPLGKGDPVRALKQKRKEIGTLAFARQYLCQPIDDSSSLFPTSLIQKVLFKDAHPVLNGYPHFAMHGWFCTMGVDLAISAHVRADAFVIATVWHLPIIVDAVTDHALLKWHQIRPTVRERLIDEGIATDSTSSTPSTPANEKDWFLSVPFTMLWDVILLPNRDCIARPDTCPWADSPPPPLTMPWDGDGNGDGNGQLGRGGGSALILGNLDEWERQRRHQQQQQYQHHTLFGSSLPTLTTPRFSINDEATPLIGGGLGMGVTIGGKRRRRRGRYWKWDWDGDGGRTEKTSADPTIITLLDAGGSGNGSGSRNGNESGNEGINDAATPSESNDAFNAEINNINIIITNNDDDHHHHDAHHVRPRHGQGWQRQRRRGDTWTIVTVSALTHIERHVGLSHEHQLMRIIDVAQRNRPRTIAIEANGFQQIMPSLLIRDDRYRRLLPPETYILPVTTTHQLKTRLPSPRSSIAAWQAGYASLLQSGEAGGSRGGVGGGMGGAGGGGGSGGLQSIPAMQHQWFEQRRVAIPSPLPHGTGAGDGGGDGGGEAFKQLITELQNFTWQKTPQGNLTIKATSTSIHDDTVIATWLAFAAKGPR